MISRARWQRIQSIFEAVVDAPPHERARRLENSCGSDAELQRSVESLLDSDDRPTDPLKQMVGEAAESLLTQHQDRLVGTRVGQYRIVSVLGQGGMSTVYRGERDDAQYRRIVAVKVLHHPTLHPRLRNRLHSERHILAKLEHPSISRLIDSGELEDGTPYLVMEHVDGEVIDSYCDKRTLFIRERLELFVEVCAAVQFAHRNLVVHRDIKAANILVTDAGKPKLLDFGIAKLLAPEGLAHTVPVTRLQERILTPENAAPEQVLGRSITTATDIYALGVLLYQLLTGRSPYRLLSYSQLQLERAICMDDPVRPSQIVVAGPGGESDADREQIAGRRGVSAQRLRAGLAGDLDAIVAMAMRKEPEHRYASVDALADDVTRHLQGKPVLARQGDWRYNGAKFLRRHLLPTALVTGSFVALAAFAGVAVWQNHRIEAARAATVQERDHAREVSAFLVEVFSEADPFKSQGHEATAGELLDRGAAKIVANASLQPEVRAQLLESIGLAYRRKGDSERAIPLFEQAVAIRRAERPHDDHRTAAAMANLARALNESGNLSSAEGYLQQALDLSRRADAAPSVETADILVEFAQFELNVKCDQPRAMKLFGQALDIYRSVLGGQHPSVALTLSGLASAAVWASDFASAEKYERQAIDIYRVAVSRNHPDYAVALATLGYILTERGQFREAEQLLTEALQIERTVFGGSNDRIAQIDSQFSLLYEREDDLPHAVASIQEAIEIESKVHDPSYYLRGYYLASLAGLQLKAGDLAGAETTARQSLYVLQLSLPSRHLYVASARQMLGEILLSRGAATAAEAEFRAAAEINATLVGGDQWRTARSQASLGWALIEDGHPEEGEPLLVAARKRLLATVGAANPSARTASARLSSYYRSRHRDAEASAVLADPGKL